MAGESGFGIAITFVTSAWTGEIVDIPSLDNVERGSIETSHHGLYVDASTEKGKTFIASLLYDPGSMTVVVNHSSDNPPPINPRESIKVTFPDTAGKIWACDGFVVKSGVAIPIEDRMLQTMEIKFSGDWNYDSA